MKLDLSRITLVVDGGVSYAQCRVGRDMYRTWEQAMVLQICCHRTSPVFLDKDQHIEREIGDQFRVCSNEDFCPHTRWT